MELSVSVKKSNNKIWLEQNDEIYYYGNFISMQFFVSG